MKHADQQPYLDTLPCNVCGKMRPTKLYRCDRGYETRCDACALAVRAAGYVRPGIARYCHQMVNKAAVRASVTGKAFNITPTEVKRYVSSPGTCEITGVPFDLTSRSLRPMLYLVDKDGNWTRDNVLIVCAIVSRLSKYYPREEIIDFCRLVVDTNG